MAIVSWAGNVFRGLSSETKPSATTYAGFIFQETDTGRLFCASGGVWTDMSYHSGQTTYHIQQHSGTSSADHTFPGGVTTFLRADGTFAATPGGGNIESHITLLASSTAITI